MQKRNEKANTASGLTTSGEFIFVGNEAMPMMWKSWTTIGVKYVWQKIITPKKKIHLW